jgi:hypothetical protein
VKNDKLFEHDEFRANLSCAIQSGEVVYAGNHSFTWQGVKYRLKPVCKLWPNAGGEIQWLTPGEAARAELERAFPSLKRTGWPGQMVKLLNLRPPFVYTGVARGSMWLVDLSSAYWTIYRKLWLNTAWPRGKGTLSLEPVADRLKDWKTARNAVIGIVRSTRVTMYYQGQAKSLAIKNRFLSPPLWATVCQVLQDISYLAKPIYVNTDGFVFDQEQQVMGFCYKLEKAGLKYTIVSGYGEIAGWNLYQIGQKKTALYGQRPRLGGRPFDNRLPERERSFLKWWTEISL